MGQKLVIVLIAIAVVLLVLVRLSELSTRMRTFEQFIASSSDSNDTNADV